MRTATFADIELTISGYVTAMGCAWLQVALHSPAPQWSNQNGTEIRKPNTAEARTDNLLDMLS